MKSYWLRNRPEPQERTETHWVIRDDEHKLLPACETINWDAFQHTQTVMQSAMHFALNDTIAFSCNVCFKRLVQVAKLLAAK
jgi:hypothetical protein